MIRQIFSFTTELVLQTTKGSAGRRHRRQVHQVKSKKGNKGNRKAKKKKGGIRSSSRSKKKLKQSNLDRALVENLDVKGFGYLFQVQHPSDVTRVGFQNCGPQRQSQHNKKI